MTDFETRRARAIGDTRAAFGVTTSTPYRNGIIVSQSDYDRMASLATRPAPPSGWDSLFGFPVWADADWKFDPSVVARARMVAVSLRPFARIVRWLSALLDAASRDGGRP